DNRRFAATVDGTKAARIVETKAKHNKVVTAPTPYEIRQLAWQMFVLPEFDGADWVWVELVRDRNTGEWVMRRDPQTLVFDR
ncbi:hypothetical protein JVW21_20545, partial [Vibrio cholerae O1]|uniref:hypothetical protein n=1 Tax=Vibrio cholerae TaxID=666 RepID=UPI001C0F8048